MSLSRFRPDRSIDGSQALLRANYRAACKAQSAKAFKSKLSISFEEIDEALFWLEAINDLNLIPQEKIALLLKEADELTRILAATRIKLENKKRIANS